MNGRNISILIPSMDRPNQIVQQLSFYHALQTDININICDSTNKPSINFKKSIDFFSKTLSINYFHEPELNDRQAIFYLIDNCKTEYSSFIGDDDLFIPEGMIKSADFLNKNPDYRVAYGNSITVDEEFLNNRKKRTPISPYWGKPFFPQKNCLERLSAFSKSYFIPMFAIHRTKEFLEDYLPCKEIPSKEMGEILINYITIAKGKAMYIPEPYLIRKVHSQRYLVTQNFVDSLVDENFAESIPIFINNIQEILLNSNTSKKRSHIEARNFVKKLLIEKFNNSSLSKKNNFFLIRLCRIFFQRIFCSFKNKIFRSSIYMKAFYKYVEILENI